MEDKQEIPTLEEIRSKLGSMVLVPGYEHFRCDVGRFIVRIWTPPPYKFTGNNSEDREREERNRQKDRITKCDTVSIDLREMNGTSETRIRLDMDYRFKDYQPIQYEIAHDPYPQIVGDDMPIHHLCELIRYLYRLNNLTAFE